MSKKFYITTPIYYVNASPHIGHTYTTVTADILARYHRMIGDSVFFLTGTDEHGAKIEEKALEAGKNPQEFTDEVSASFKLAWDELNISNDRFIRTTEESHKKAVQEALKKMHDNGDIYLGKHEGLYCKGCEQYLNEKDLVEGKCPDHKTVPEKMSEESYMFKLSKYKDELLKKIKNDDLKILPVERKNEVVSFYEKEGLNDISFSRKNVQWGIPLPWDKSHTTYVWADAFLNYLTGLGWSGENPPASPFNKGGNMDFWPPDLHLMSKDILRVHATIWPAMLLSLGLLLPETLFIHGFFLIDGQKMSKSIGNVITPQDLVKKYGVDATRYLLASVTPFGHDGDVSWEKFDEKFNADLANGLGNLVARVLTMTEKYFDGKIPSGDKEGEVLLTKFPQGFFPSEITDKEIKSNNSPCLVGKFIETQLHWYKENLNDFNIDSALVWAKSCSSALDIYITEYQPFKLIKENKEKTAAVLYNCLESIRLIAWMVWPFMPDTAEKIWESLGLDAQKEKSQEFKDAIKWGGLEVDVKIKKGEALFPRINK